MLEELKALSDETRLKLISDLIEGCYCVGALAQRNGLTASAVSQHLSVLRDAGLVTAIKEGYYTHYRIEKQAFFELAEKLREMCAGAPGPGAHHGGNGHHHGHCRMHCKSGRCPMRGEADV